MIHIIKSRMLSPKFAIFSSVVIVECSYLYEQTINMHFQVYFHFHFSVIFHTIRIFTEDLGRRASSQKRTQCRKKKTERNIAKFSQRENIATYAKRNIDESRMILIRHFQ